jgi:Spy/CpxP family protein refolding chaperone
MNWKQAIARGIAVASLSAIGAVPILAQPGMGGARDNMNPEERLDRRLDFMDEKLDLSDEQVKEVRGILENAHAEASAWHEDNPEAARKDRRAFRDEHRAATKEAIGNILTDDQKAQFDSLKDGRGRRGRGRHRGARRAHRDGKILHRLDLSDEQKEQLKTLRKEHREAMKASLTEILTEKQMAKFTEMRERRKGRWNHGPRHH